MQEHDLSCLHSGLCLDGAGVPRCVFVDLRARLLYHWRYGPVGYAKFNLALIDHKGGAGFRSVFAVWPLRDGFLLNLLMTIFVVLWSLLLVIPGIIAAYSYAMAPYILL